jgi:hypothetical protein
MPGWGEAAGKASDYVQGRAERRRNNIKSLEREQDELKDKKNKTSADKKRLVVIARELGKLYDQGANQA